MTVLPLFLFSWVLLLYSFYNSVRIYRQTKDINLMMLSVVFIVLGLFASLFWII